MLIRGLAALVVASAVVVGCDSTGPSDTLAPSSDPGVTPTPVEADAGPCDGTKIDLVPGPADMAAGTSYITFRAELAGGPPCLLIAWPSIQVIDGSDVLIAEGPGEPSHLGETVILTTFRHFHIGWNSWCLAPPERPLTAHIGLVDNGRAIGFVPLVLPDSYGPSECKGGQGNPWVEPEP